MRDPPAGGANDPPPAGLFKAAWNDCRPRGLLGADQRSASHMRPIVAVPARNEEERLPRLLRALEDQTVARERDALDVVVVLNNTRDNSRRVLEAAALACRRLRLDIVETVYPPRLAHVGSARRLAMERALARLGTGSEGVILTTDADAAPAADWVERNLAAVARGAALVGGRIAGEREEEAAHGPGFALRARLHGDYHGLCDRLAALIDPLPHDPWPRHHDHTGASLAIRADVYRAVGGLPALPFREDLGLVARVLAAGHRLVHPLDVRVTVSARLRGRAPGGMADCLAGWLADEENGAPVLVEDPDFLEARLVRRRSIRDLAGLPPSASAPILLGLGACPAQLPGGPLSPAGIGRLIATLAPDEPDAPRTVPVHRAMERMRAKLQRLEQTVDAA